MSEDRNIATVKDAYGAFQRGDIKAILALLDDAVDWHGVKGTEGVAPHAGQRHGKAAVEQFFGQVAASTQFTRFEPREFIAQGDAVAVVGYYEATIAGTGRGVAADWVMVFNFRNGKVVRFREWTDSAGLVKAYGAAAVA